MQTAWWSCPGSSMAMPMQATDSSKPWEADNSEAWFKACENIYSEGTTEEFWYAEALLSALERLKCGITCGVSMLGGGPT